MLRDIVRLNANVTKFWSTKTFDYKTYCLAFGINIRDEINQENCNIILIFNRKCLCCFLAVFIIN